MTTTTRFIHEAGLDIPQGSSIAIRQGDNKLIAIGPDEKRIGYASQDIKEGDRVIIKNGFARVLKDGEQ